MVRHGKSPSPALTIFQFSFTAYSLTMCRYYSKPAFYVFVPVFELTVSAMYAAARVDRLFYAFSEKEPMTPLYSRTVEDDNERSSEHQLRSM